MVIGIPKEILQGENRVSAVPEVVSKYIKSGFTVNVEQDAGLSAGYTNEKYSDAGAKIISGTAELFQSADVILKVQRPIENESLKKHELDLMKPGTLLITFLYPLHYYELDKEK